MTILKNLVYNLSEFPGWHTNRKIVVIESDDWGGIRMHSKKAIQAIENKGVKITDAYNQYDALASEEDLQCLFEVLTAFKDKNGNPPVITANTIMANPDFKKIKASNFTEYHTELFTKTLTSYPKHTRSFQLWKEGMDAKVFKPQYHGRDHVHIFKWLHQLKDKNSMARIGFENQVFGLRDTALTSMRDSFMRALDFESMQQKEKLLANLKEGLHLFNKLFGYTSRSFIAPSYVWDDTVEDLLCKEGVLYMQGIKYQYMPVIGRTTLQKKLHYTGQRNAIGQIYLTRNAFFEPSITNQKNIDLIIKRMEIAFRWKKPVILGSHRLNYIGFLNSKNRDENLKLFSELLTTILKKWSDVEFMTSDKLGDIITGK